MANSANIKDEIVKILDNLKSNDVIRQVVVLNQVTDPFYENKVNTYPCAVVLPPSTTVESGDQRTNINNYTFIVGVFMRLDRMDTNTYIEEIIDPMLSDFGDNPTLSGEADAGLTVKQGTTEIIDDHSRIAYFGVQLNAKAKDRRNY